MTTKIALIGAGSAVFSLSLIGDLCLTPNLAGSTITFMDINPDRLDAAHRLCQRYADEVGARLILEKTTDRRQALDGADFVINTALAAGHQRLKDGLAIGRKHGYRFGGSYHVMHDEGFWINFYQLQLFESVVEDIMAICPQAWHLLVANPVLAAITYLGRKYPQAKVVGLCHGFSGVYRVARVLGLDREGLTFEIPGVNHSVWLTHLYHYGEDVFPLLDDWIETKAAQYWQQCSPCDAMGPKAIDLYRRFGAFPIGDTCHPGGGSWPWWHHTDSETEARWREDPAGWWERYLAGLEEEVAEIKQVSADTSIKVTDHFPPEMSGEVMVPLIESIACDKPQVLVANIFNTGNFVPGIPADFEVEIPCLVSKRGVQGIQTRGLSDPLLAYILHDRVAPVNLELAAYEAGSKQLLHQLILMDPWTRSEEQARALLEEILALPYHEAMRHHYQ